MIKKIGLGFLGVFFVSLGFAQDLDDKVAEIVAYLDGRIPQIQSEWNIPGMAVAVVVGDKVIFKKAFGIRNISKPEAKVNESTIFQIGSCSKAFTAVLSAMLVDDGYFNWDDRVIDIYENFEFSNPKLSEEITYADLLGQRSGLHSYALHYMLLFGYDRAEVVNGLRYVKQVGQVGKTYAYQNATYLLAGEIIKFRTGYSWEYNIQKRIFDPLNMKSTTVDFKSYVKSGNRTVGHFYSGGILRPTPDSLPYNKWPYVFAPAGGINTNINDMSNWMLFLINQGSPRAGKKALVSRLNFNRIFEKGVATSKDTFYALGWRQRDHKGKSVFWHGGTTDTQGAFVSFMPEEKIGIVVLMNLNNASAADALSKEVYDNYLLSQTKDWSKGNLRRAENRNQARIDTAKGVEKTIKNPALELNKYVGKFSNPMYGEVIVVIENGILSFSAGSFETWIRMKHFDGNDFGAFDLPGWRFKNPMFHFRVDKNGEVIGLFVEQMSDGTDGFFKRVK
jgi:CubicO group peptidase (beta-lactamase class C family)